MEPLPLPNSNKKKILYHIITVGPISEREQKQNGYRARISELEKKSGMHFTEKIHPFVNEHGNKGEYKSHEISESDRESWVNFYKRMFK